MLTSYECADSGTNATGSLVTMSGLRNCAERPPLARTVVVLKVCSARAHGRIACCEEVRSVPRTPAANADFARVQLTCVQPDANDGSDVAFRSAVTRTLDGPLAVNFRAVSFMYRYS